MTRGETNSNPGNIRHVKGVAWVGQSIVQADDAFVQFTSPVYGIRAIARILKSYDREGIHTLTEAIDRWAPPNENNSASYVSDVCQRCGVNPDSPVVLSAMLPELVKAIIWHENGECIYTDEQINQGITLS
jgi:hypothetical protein